MFAPGFNFGMPVFIDKPTPAAAASSPQSPLLDQAPKKVEPKWEVLGQMNPHDKYIFLATYRGKASTLKVMHTT